MLFALMLVTAVLEMVGVGMFLPLLQLLATPESALENSGIVLLVDLFKVNDTQRLIFIFSIIIFVFFALKSTVLAAVIFMQNRFITSHRALYSQDLLRLYLNQPYVFHLQRNTAELIRNITTLSSRIFVKGLLPILQIAMETMVIIGMVIVLMLVDPVATLIVGGILGGVLGIFYLSIRHRLREWGRHVIGYDSEIFLWINQALGSIKETKLYRNEHYFYESYAKPSNAQAGFLAKSTTVPYLPRLVIEAVAVGAMALLVAILTIQSENSSAAAIPQIGLFAIVALRLMPSLSKLVSSVTLLRDNEAAVNALYDDIINTPIIAITDKSGSELPPMVFQHNIQLIDVDYKYPETDENVIRKINLTIDRGQSVAIVGGSGAGKTTLVDLILGLLEPVGGGVFVDGRNISENMISWQSLISYIPQEIYLTDDSLRRNVALARDDHQIDPRRLAEALEMAQLTDFVGGLPEGPETTLGERGARISGGQRQRIGIARAIYNDPEVLVMDEATSSLDGATEREIAAAVDQLAGDKTLIIIAHRLSTVRHCNSIVMMDQGKVVDHGTFDDLAARNLNFQHMIKLASVSSGEPI